AKDEWTGGAAIGWPTAMKTSLFCHVVSLCVASGLCGFSADESSSLARLEEQARGGNGEAQFMVGFRYAYGKDAPKDVQKGIEWFRKGAENNNADAQGFLGRHYMDGDGVPQNFSEGLKWLRKAAAVSNTLAAVALARAYDGG